MKSSIETSMQLTVDDFKASHRQEDHAPHSALPLAAGAGNSMTLEEIERAFIAAAIKKHSGNLSLVAKELGISRGALYRKIEKHGL